MVRSVSASKYRKDVKTRSFIKSPNIMQQKILIVGANGFTGRHILNTLAGKANYQVIGCSLHPDICPNIDSYRFVQTDIRKEATVRHLFDELRPDVVINTSALSSPDYCENHREETNETNIRAVAHLAMNCERLGSRLIHLSTDFVFSGTTNHLYTEEDTPTPVNYYGRSKWESEQQVARLCGNYAVARIVVVYGHPLPGQHGNIVRLVADRLRSGQSIRVVNDQWRTPTFVDDVAQGIELLIGNPANGAFHICGPECLTIADIAYRVADVLKLDSLLIQPVSTGEMQETTPRPRFSGLSIDKARHVLGYRPHSLDEGIRAMFS